MQQPLDNSAKEYKDLAKEAVKNIFKYPSDLAQLDSYRRKLIKSKELSEGQLKAALQQQLDDVRAGLQHMEEARTNISSVKFNLLEVWKSCQHLDSLRLDNVISEHQHFLQVVTARDNLLLIDSASDLMKTAQNKIQEGKPECLLEAHQKLMDLGACRDNLLYDIDQNIREATSSQTAPIDQAEQLQTITNLFRDLDEIMKALWKELTVLASPLTAVARKEPAQLVTVLRIVEREEVIDRAWLAIAETDRSLGRSSRRPFMPPGRPLRWRNKLLECFQQSVHTRVDGCLLETRETEKSWLVRHLEHLRQLILQDLCLIKSIVVPCFPPEYKIFEQFVKWFHETLRIHLANLITGTQLEPNEKLYLLSWTFIEYKSTDLLGHSELNAVGLVGDLLSPSEAEHLKSDYMQTTETQFRRWLSNALLDDANGWEKDEAPKISSDGSYTSNLPTVFVPMFEENFKMLKKMYSGLLKSYLQVSLGCISSFVDQYRGRLNDYYLKRKANRQFAKNYFYYVIAATNNASIIGEYVAQLQKRYESLLSASQVAGAAAASTGTALSSGEPSQRTEQNSSHARRAGVRLNQSDEASTNPFDVENESTGQLQGGGTVARSHSPSNGTSTNPFDECVDSSTPAAVADTWNAGPAFEAVLSSINQMIELGVRCLREEIEMDIRKFLSLLFTNCWRDGNAEVKNIGAQLVDSICVTIEDYGIDLSHLRASIYPLAIRQLTDYIALQYLAAFTQKRTTFRTNEERTNAGSRIKEEIGLLSDTFKKLKAEKSNVLDILTCLNGLISADEPDLMLRLELRALKNKFADMPARQVLNVVLMRSDLSAADANERVTDLFGKPDVPPSLIGVAGSMFARLKDFATQ